LKLQLMLTYNSKVWDYGAPVPPDAVGEWRPVAGDPALGIGWTFTPGKIQPCGTGLPPVSRSDRLSAATRGLRGGSETYQKAVEEVLKDLAILVKKSPELIRGMVP